MNALSSYTFLESWAILHEKLQFVPPFTEEARDWYLRRHFKPSGSIIVHANVRALGKKK